MRIWLSDRHLYFLVLGLMIFSANCLADILHLAEDVEIVDQSPVEKFINLNNQQGSIYGLVNLKSHEASSTLFSARWNENDSSKQGYMVLSNGWWEHSVAPALYFVIDNQQHAFCYTKNFKIKANIETFVAVTWGPTIDSRTDKSLCQIYINGELYTSEQVSLNVPKSTSTISLFSDKYSDGPAKRFAQGQFKAWTYTSEVLDYQQISALDRQIREQTQDKTEGVTFSERYMFDEDIFWALSEANTREVLDNLVDAGFNHYVPCVWHGNGAYFPREDGLIDARLTHRIKTLNQDPLLFLVKEARKREIKVHPWFTVMRREGNLLPEYGLDNTEAVFNVHSKEFRQFISGLILDVAWRYPVDGINLDYIRSIALCTSKSCQADFREKYQSSLPSSIHDLKTAKLSQHVAEWNAESVTDIVRRIAQGLPREGKKILLSIDAHPLNSSLEIQGQNSLDWANSGLIDKIFAMEYAAIPNLDKLFTVRSMLVTPSALTPLYSLFSLSGEVVIPRSNALLRTYIEKTSKELSLDSIGFYHYKQLTNHQREIMRTLADGVAM